MPRIVVRKSYRCQPGKRRELLAALQRVDAVAAEAGWPRGRYLFIETKSPGEPDVEVEFTFESYSEMEQLERRLREHLGRSPRDASSIGSAGQEFLLEPSSTRYLLLLDDGAGTPARRTATAAPGAPAAPPAPATGSGSSAGRDPGPPFGSPSTSTGSAGGVRPSGPVGPAGAVNPVTAVSPAPARPPAPAQPAIQRRAPGVPSTPPSASPGPFPAARRPPAPAPPPEPEPDYSPDLGEEEFEDFEDQVEVPPDPYASLTPAEKKLRQLADARAALSRAEDATNVSPEQRARARQATQRGPQTD